MLHNGAWPQIAGRRVAANVRWGQPDGVLELYQLGSEGAQWWVDYPDAARNLPANSIFHRCNLSGTCPKVIEHFGGSEVFALKMTMEWVGTSADFDIPLTRNVRRYYIGSTTHGGGGGGFVHQPPATGANCPGNNWGTGTFRANPMPSTQMINVIRLAMRAWLMNGTPPPPSRYPTLIGGTLVNPTRLDMGFPAGVPGVPESVFEPENFIFPVFDYDWGPDFNRADGSGVPTNLPPPITKVIPMKVPRVDADGNELGGVPTVLRDAPLGTYLGWNMTAAGFHKGQVCNYVGGYIPFATTPRGASGQRRPAPLAGRALRRSRRLCRGRDAGCEQCVRAGLPAGRRSRRLDRPGRGERRSQVVNHERIDIMKPISTLLTLALAALAVPARPSSPDRMRQRTGRPCRPARSPEPARRRAPRASRRRC
jgi:hypothetical protein